MFGEHGHCDLSLPLSLPLSFLGIQLAYLLRRMLTIQNPKKSWLTMKPACNLVDDASLGHGCPLPALAALASLFGREWASQLALLSPLFCEQAWWCLSLGLFSGVAIKGSGMLSQVSSLRFPSVHSGPVLTLSNAARTSLPSPRLLVADAGVCAASPLGVTIGCVICGFKLFIYFSNQLCCPLRFQGSPQTRQ